MYVLVEQEVRRAMTITECWVHLRRHQWITNTEINPLHEVVDFNFIALNARRS